MVLAVPRTDTIMTIISLTQPDDMSDLGDCGKQVVQRLSLHPVHERG